MAASTVHHLNPVKSLLQEFSENKDTIKELQARNSAIAAELRDLAVFGAGKRTGKLFIDGIKASVSVPVTIKWDQTQLNKARAEIGDDLFMKFFIFKWEHRDKRALAMAPDAIKAAMHEKEGPPQVTVEFE